MPEYTITVEATPEDIAELRTVLVELDKTDHIKWDSRWSATSDRLRRALIEAATPPPVTSITLDCLTGTPPNLLLQINEDDDQPRLYVNIGGKAVVLPFDDVIDAVTQLRDTAKEMQS